MKAYNKDTSVLAYNLFSSSLFFTATTHAFPTFLLMSNQLFIKGTFNPPNYTRQLPFDAYPISLQTNSFLYLHYCGPLSSQTSN